MRKLLGVALTLMAVAACGGDGGTNPPTNVDLTGTWAVTVTPIQGTVVRCEISDLVLQVSQNGTALTGTYSATDMVCNGNHTGPGSGPIVNGTHVDGAVQIDLKSEDFDLQGSVKTSHKMAGDYTAA